MRPRKMVALKASDAVAWSRRRFQLHLWGYAPVAYEAMDTAPACVLLDGLLEPHHVAEARERWPCVPVMVISQDILPAGREVFLAAGAAGVVDPLSEGNCTVRERLRVMCSLKRGPKRRRQEGVNA